jgi:hypothetical protein
MVVWRWRAGLAERSDDAVGTTGGTVSEPGDSVAEGEEQRRPAGHDPTVARSRPATSVSVMKTATRPCTAIV